MSANEKLRSIAYALGLTMTTSQEKAYGEFKGFPLLLTVTSDEELLAQFYVKCINFYGANPHRFLDGGHCHL